MKIRTEDNLLLTNSTGEKKFTIQASAKAFQILSSALYSRKIEAIIRELGCNAADSHTQAGYPERPFVVHLPNSWEPEFYVEDFGIGLDASDVENIYTSYFTSTKTDSNDVTGGFGLGSKTPFSYCDSFNIRTRKAGVEYHFNAYINMQGEPATTMLSCVPTTEPNGVRVTVPVKVTDYNQFRTDAFTVYKWFQVVPTITGGAAGNGITIDNARALRLIKEQSFWAEYSKDGWDKNSITAVMGNVAYHVPNVSTTFNAHFNGSERKFFEHNSLFIQFNIGDLDVAASRETISFDEDTEAAFVARVKLIVSSFCKETQDKLDTMVRTVPEAIALVESSVGTWANQMFTYKGRTVDSWSDENFIKGFQTAIDIDNYYFARTRKGAVKRHALDYIGGFTFAKLGQRKIVVIVGDDKGFQTMARQLCWSTDIWGVLFIDKEGDPIEVAQLKEVFGDNLEFMLAADLIAADKARRKAIRDAEKAAQGPSYRKPAVARIGRDTLRAKVFSMIVDTNGQPNSSFVEKGTVSVESVKGKTALVLAERYSTADVKLTHPVAQANISYTIACGNETAMFNFCRLFGYDMLIIIKPESLKKATKLFDGLIKFDEPITTVNVEHIKALTVRRKVVGEAGSLTVKDLIDKHCDDAPELISNKMEERANEFVKNNPDGEFAKAIELTSSLTTYDYYSYIPPAFRNLVTADTGIIDNSITATVKGICRAVNDDYPMVGFSDGGSNIDTLVEYIHYMDKIRELNLIVGQEVVKEVEEVVDDEDFPF